MPPNVHGWNDYFFQTHLAREISRLGGAFYALDLRKYGRSMRPHHTPNYVTDLREHFAELDRVAREHAHTPADAVVLDLGLSSIQLADDRRGITDIAFDVGFGDRYHQSALFKIGRAHV